MLELAIKFIITSKLPTGFIHQFLVMCANMLCAILFHFLVPGAKWQTGIFGPVSNSIVCVQRSCCCDESRPLDGRSEQPPPSNRLHAALH